MADAGPAEADFGNLEAGSAETTAIHKQTPVVRCSRPLRQERALRKLANRTMHRLEIVEIFKQTSYEGHPA